MHLENAKSVQFFALAQTVDKEAIQRGLGIIEGIAWTASDEVADALLTAVEMIEGALGIGREERS